MRVVRTDSFKRDYNTLPKPIQKQVDRKLIIFLANPRHPSLQVKRVQGYENLWEGRVTQNYRFLFSWLKDSFVLLRVGSHRLVDRL